MQLEGLPQSWRIGIELYKVRSPLEKYRKHLMKQDKQIEVRRRYNVPTQSSKTRRKVYEDFEWDTGRSLSTYFGEMELNT
jgi:hypothetical protein